MLCALFSRRREEGKEVGVEFVLDIACTLFFFFLIFFSFLFWVDRSIDGRFKFFSLRCAVPVMSIIHNTTSMCAAACRCRGMSFDHLPPSTLYAALLPLGWKNEIPPIDEVPLLAQTLIEIQRIAMNFKRHTTFGAGARLWGGGEGEK